MTIIKASNLKAMDLTGFSGVSGLRPEEEGWGLREEASAQSPGFSAQTPM